MVQADAVITEEFAQTAPTIGRFVATRNGVVKAAVDGPVAEILVEVGNRVSAGETLAVLDLERLTASRDLRRAAVDETEARLRTANTDASLQRAELSRLDRLKKSAAFNQARYEDAQLQVNRAVAEIARAVADRERAWAELRLAETDLSRAVIKAPFPGVVTERHTELGSYVRAGDPIVSMLDDSNVEIEADVPFARIAGLSPGLEIAIANETGLAATAILRAIVPVENPLTRTRPVRFRPNLPVGMAVATDQSVTLRLPVGEARSVITVHKDAINRGARGANVFVVTDGKAALRPVQLGESVGNRIEVLAGLTPGEQVVIRGNERLRPGQSVTLAPGEPSTPATSGGTIRPGEAQPQSSQSGTPPADTRANPQQAQGQSNSGSASTDAAKTGESQ